MEFILPLLLALLSLPMPWQFHLVQLLSLALGLVAVNPAMGFCPIFLPFRIAAAGPKTRLVFLAGILMPSIAALTGILFLRSGLGTSLDAWKIPLAVLESGLASALLFHGKGLFFFLSKGSFGAIFTGESPQADSYPRPLFLYMIAMARFADLRRLGLIHPNSMNGRSPGIRHLSRIWLTETCAALKKLAYPETVGYIRVWNRFMGILPGSMVALLPFMILPLAGLILPFLP